jgi:hypothetical protein
MLKRVAMAISGPDNDEKPQPLALTLPSRQRLGLVLGAESDARSILEARPFLEEGLAALIDAGHLDPAFRLISRMLDTSGAILWVLLCFDRAQGNQPEPNLQEKAARSALLEFAKKPNPGTLASAESACRFLGGTHPLALAGSGLSLALDNRLQPDGVAVPFPSNLFPDLIGQAIRLISLSVPGEPRFKRIFAKELASRGVTIALAG